MVLPWDRPLCERAVGWLAQDWDGREALDLSDTLVVVPTRQSGRRLRAALAEHASTHARAVLSPSVLLPDQLLRLAAPAVRIAERGEVLYAWIRTLLEADLATFRSVFPSDPPRRDFQWALALAEEFAGLQDTLAEGGLRFGGMSARLEGEFSEPERWAQLGALEELFDVALESIGRVAPAVASAAAQKGSAAPPKEVCRVVLLAIADPRPDVLSVLSHWSGSVEVSVLLYCATGDESRFDLWGRPIPASWNAAALEIPDAENRIHVCADGSVQARDVARWARPNAGRAGVLALGCADPALEAPLAAALTSEGIAPFRPEGVALSGHQLAGLLEALRKATLDDGWDTFQALARRAEVLRWIATDESAIRQILEGIDQVQRSHLPATLAEAMRHAGDLSRDSRFSGLDRALKKLKRLLAQLREGSFPETWNSALQQIFGGRTFRSEDARDRRFLEAAETWSDVVRTVGERTGLSAPDSITFALHLFGSRRLFEEKAPGSVEIDGWLELLFRDEPHLVLAGCQDEVLPGAICGHPFLPDSLRARLDLRTNEQRLARDAWILAALLACRASSGRVDLFLSRVSADGDPLRPSRLLFLCPDAELPQRVVGLLRELPPPDAAIPWRRAWRLKVPIGDPARSLRVTAFRDYLRCPFRFHLKHGLRLEAVEPDKQELDPFDFGRLLHWVLERLGKDDDWRNCTDAERLAREFAEELDRIVRGRYGRTLSLPLLIQVESAGQRLQQAARLQAAERADGWIVRHAEWRFPANGPKLGGLSITGTIDRIEQNERSGAWRVLDYKSSETGIAPEPAHIRNAGRREGTPRHLPEAEFEWNGGDRIWLDLQLPLYRWAVAEALGVKGPEIAYFNLPKAVTETAIVPWSEFDGDLEKSALRCAKAIASAVAARQFWPPVEELDGDEYEALFHQGTEGSVVLET